VSAFRRRVVAVEILSTMVISGPASAAPPLPHHRPTVLQQGLDDLHDLGISGAQGLVRDGRRVSAARSGVANLDTATPMPIDGYFRIGSSTKTFVSVVLLQLVGEGRLQLDDPIERRLPQELRPGIAYGLGIMWIPNRCGGFWAHFGDMPGVSTLKAITPDGHRSAVLYVATVLADPGRAPAVMQREMTLLDDLICG
jgi:hypothetical protein